jgi:hypothetical protein
MATEDLMAKFGVKTGGGFNIDNGMIVDAGDNKGQYPTMADAIAAGGTSAGGRRRRHSKGRKGNSWLDHVKYTMKDKKNKGKSFKQILKIAKKTYKKSQSQSGSKGRKGTRRGQYGGSGGKIDGLSGSPYV